MQTRGRFAKTGSPRGLAILSAVVSRQQNGANEPNLSTTQAEQLLEPALLERCFIRSAQKKKPLTRHGSASPRLPIILIYVNQFAFCAAVSGSRVQHFVKPRDLSVESCLLFFE